MERFRWRTLIICLACILVISAWSFWIADASEANFQSLRCGLCHKADRGSAVPSLPEIARAYSGQQQRLVHYLKGESEPLIDLGKRRMMEPKLARTKEISDTERRDLADYILSFSGK